MRGTIVAAAAAAAAAVAVALVRGAPEQRLDGGGVEGGEVGLVLHRLRQLLGHRVGVRRPPRHLVLRKAQRAEQLRQPRAQQLRRVVEERLEVCRNIDGAKTGESLVRWGPSGSDKSCLTRSRLQQANGPCANLQEWSRVPH